MAALSFPDEYRQMLARLREARRAAGLTQAEVAQAMGRPQSFVAKIEAGERRLDPIELWHLAKLYRVEIMSLLPRG